MFARNLPASTRPRIACISKCPHHLTMSQIYHYSLNILFIFSMCALVRNVFDSSISSIIKWICERKIAFARSWLAIFISRDKPLIKLLLFICNFAINKIHPPSGGAWRRRGRSRYRVRVRTSNMNRWWWRDGSCKWSRIEIEHNDGDDVADEEMRRQRSQRREYFFLKS